jgi:hypothetical protein
MLGFILLGLAVMRARVFPRGVGVLLIVATLLNSFGEMLVGDAAFYLGSVMFGIALGWLGYALWSDRRVRQGAGSR